MTDSGSEPTARRRRVYGQGAVYKNEQGLWIATSEISAPGGGGRRRRIKRKAKTKAEAIRKLRHAEQQLATTGVIPDLNQTMTEYLEWWLEHVIPLRVKASTVAQYRWITEKYLVRLVGHHRIGRLTTGQVQSMITEVIASGRSPNTTRQIVGVLSGALRHAVRTDLIVRNPCQYVDLPRVVRKVDDDTLTAADVGKFLRACEGTRWEPFATLAPRLRVPTR